MDQLQPILAGIKKHYFWILLGVMVVTGVTVWHLGTSALADQTQRERTKRDGDFQKVQQIASREDHPNAQFPPFIQSVEKQLKADIDDAHRKLYDAQQKVFKLPKLTESVTNQLQALEPDAPIPAPLRRQFMSEVVDAFREMLNSEINLRRKSESGPGLTGLVVWPKELRESRAKRYAWSKEPSTAQIRYALEDYNLYRVLLHVIDAANENCRDHLAAVVKEIIRLDFGGRAASKGGNSNSRSKSKSAQNDAEFLLIYGTKLPRPRKAAASRSKVKTPQSVADVTKNRYINELGAPISGESNHPFANFKMIPVRLQLTVDQRRLTRLLAKLANAELPIEILQLRINSNRGFNPLPDSVPKSGSGGGKSEKRQVSNMLERTRFDVEVSILAAMYLFEPAPPSEEEKADAVAGKSAKTGPAKGNVTPPNTNQGTNPGTSAEQTKGGAGSPSTPPPADTEATGNDGSSGSESTSEPKPATSPDADDVRAPPSDTGNGAETKSLRPGAPTTP